MKKISKFLIPGLIFIFILFILVIPAVSSAYNLGDPLVPKCSENPVTKQCGWGWNELLLLLDNLITFMLKFMAIPIAAIMFAYAGLLLVTAGGEAAHAREKAKGIFLNAVIGLIIAVSAWLIVSTILWILGYDGSWIGLKVGV